MKDAELIGLAALVNASCTEISSANQFRQMQDASPAYGEYADMFGDRPSLRIADELARRQRMRDIEREFEQEGEECSEVETKYARFCMLKKEHEGAHAVVFEQYGEKVFAEWQR